MPISLDKSACRLLETSYACKTPNSAHFYVPIGICPAHQVGRGSVGCHPEPGTAGITTQTVANTHAHFIAQNTSRRQTIQPSLNDRKLKFVRWTEYEEGAGGLSNGSLMRRWIVSRSHCGLPYISKLNRNSISSCVPDGNDSGRVLCDWVLAFHSVRRRRRHNQSGCCRMASSLVYESAIHNVERKYLQNWFDVCVKCARGWGPGGREAAFMYRVFDGTYRKSPDDMPDMVFSSTFWFHINASVVKCPSAAIFICSRVHVIFSASRFTSYQLSSYQPVFFCGIERTGETEQSYKFICVG